CIGIGGIALGGGATPGVRVPRFFWASAPALTTDAVRTRSERSRSRTVLPLHVCGGRRRLHAYANVVLAAPIAREVLAHVRVVAQPQRHGELVVGWDVDDEARVLAVLEGLVPVVAAVDVDRHRVPPGGDRVVVDRGRVV